MNKRLEEILKQVADYERESPYNYCDRWCERCPAATQMRCTLYQQELERKMICIAHGREEDDPEITEAVLEQQGEETAREIEKAASEWGDLDINEENELDPEALEGPEFRSIREHMAFVENHPLPRAAEQYRKRAERLLKKEFYPEKGMSRDLAYHFETVAWYHTLLPVKLNRGLAGFHEPAAEGDISLIDAVGQFEICKKACRESLAAWRQIAPQLPARRAQISELVALLAHLEEQIQALEDSL